jgi:glutaminase
MPIDPSPVSTGHLPPSERVRALLAEAYERFRVVDDGKNADYIPALSRVPSELFGISVAGTNGVIHAVGDTNYEFQFKASPNLSYLPWFVRPLARTSA